MATPAVPSPAPKSSPTVRQKQAAQLQKTVFCKFFRAGKCSKGRGCLYAHGDEDLRSKPDLSRTSMCPEILRGGTCDNPDCRYAHESEELRTTNVFFKSKLCIFAQRGRCKNGEACRFAHHMEEQAYFPDNQSKQRVNGNKGSREADMQSPDQQGKLDGTDGTGGWPETDSSTTGSRSSGYSLGINHAQKSQSGGSSSGNSQYSNQCMSRMSTPEGNSDGGDDSDANGLHYLHDQNGCRFGDTGGTNRATQHLTTVMLLNVPQFMTQGSLVSLLEDLSNYMSSTFDFFHCPWDPAKECNLGYAIINFYSGSYAAMFEREWSRKHLLAGCSGSRPLKIVPAPFQGLAANIQHYMSFGTALSANPRFRPLIRNFSDAPLRPLTMEALDTVSQQPGPSTAIPTQNDWAAVNQMPMQNVAHAGLDSGARGPINHRRSPVGPLPATSPAVNFAPLQQPNRHGSGQAMDPDAEALLLLASMQAHCNTPAAPQAFQSQPQPPAVPNLPYMLSLCSSYAPLDESGHYSD